MPTSEARIASNKQIFPLVLKTPGNLGINTEQSGVLLDGQWATDAPNTIIDAGGRLATRLGVQDVTTTQVTLAVPITNITVGNAALVTFTNTQFSSPGGTNNADTAAVVGSQIQFASVGGMTQINGLTGTIIAFISSAGVGGAVVVQVNINTSTFSAYTSGGTGTLIFPIQSVFEYNGGVGVGYQTVVSFYGGISVTPTAPAQNIISNNALIANQRFSGRWFFQNFNNKLIGFQPGQYPIVYTPAAGMTNLSASVPANLTGGVGATCFGRVWATQSDGQTINYSGLLNETDWGSSDSGTVDMHTVWSAGTDTVQAIFAFNSLLIICGLKHIVIYTDGRGSLEGIDPTQMYVSDIITGTGCLSQFSVAPIGQADVLFCSPIGLQSLQRLVNADNNPLTTPGKYNRTAILQQIQQEIAVNISGTYDPLQGFYLLALPVSGIVWCFDTRRPFTDGDSDTCMRTTYWNMTATALMTNHVPLTYIARNYGFLGFYATATDEGTVYSSGWISPWLLLPDELAARIKLLKRLQLIISAPVSQAVTIGFNADFQTGNSTIITVSVAGLQSQYGIAQYGLGQYGNAPSIVSAIANLRGRGQYYQFFGIAAAGGLFALDAVQADLKIGRIA